MEVFRDIPEAEYHADPCERASLSSSVAAILCDRSPLHAWAAHPRLNPDYKPETATHFDIGSVAHDLLLKGDGVAEVLDYDDWRKKEAQVFRDEARAAGKVPILRRQYDACQAMIEALRRQLGQSSKTSGLFDRTGGFEKTITWEDDGGVPCRSRLDWIAEDGAVIVDYKTAENANPDIWGRTMTRLGCDVQAAFYTRGVMKATGRSDPARFLFVVQEKSPPHALSVIGLEPHLMTIAEKKVLYALELWRECIDTNTWPGYSGQIHEATLSPWEEERWLQKELGE